MKRAAPFGLPLATAFIISACGEAMAQAVPVRSVGGTMPVSGQYARLQLDRVDGVSITEGRLVARGSIESVPLDVPAFVDTSQVVRHWALVTEANVDDKKVLTFTHAQSLDDFTIELPPTDADIKYGVFAHREGGEVMVLTWGREARCFWAYLIIGPKPGAAPAGR